jgi:hypothetical protein
MCNPRHADKLPAIVDYVNDSAGRQAQRIQDHSRGCPVQAPLGRGLLSIISTSSCANKIAPIEPGKSLDGFAGFLLGKPQFVEALEIQPKFRTCAEKMSEA